MARLLKMAKIQAIRGLHERRWTNRRIARELGVDRETVAKYVRAGPCAPKPAKAPIGSEGVGGQVTEGGERASEAGAWSEGPGIEAASLAPLLDAAAGVSKPAKAPIGSEGVSDDPALDQGPLASDPKPAKAPIGSEPPSDTADPAQSSLGSAAGDEASTAGVSLEKEYSRSACEPYRQVILEKLELGLSAQRVYQDLVQEGFDHQYHSVRRFVASLRGRSPLPFRRLECEAGEEAQVDFGTGAWIDLPGGKRRRSHVFRIVLSYSRKGYSEAVHGQHTARWAEAMIQARGIEGVRILRGLWALTKRHDAEAIERACEVAFSHGVYRLRTIRQLLKRDGPKQETFAFLDEHPIIRPLSDYGKLVATSFQRPWTPGSLSVVYCGSSVSTTQEFLPWRPPATT